MRNKNNEKRYFLQRISTLSSKSCALKKNSKIFKLVFAVLFLGLFFGFSGKASAATYYVNGSASSWSGTQGIYGAGSDANAGTLSLPKASINGAITASANGDTIYVANSQSYTENNSGTIGVFVGKNLTILADSGPVTINTSATGQVVFVNKVAPGVTFGGSASAQQFNLVGSGTTDSGINFNQGGHTFNGSVTGIDQSGVFLAAAGTVSLPNYSPTLSTGAAVRFSVGSVEWTGGTATLSGASCNAVLTRLDLANFDHYTMTGVTANTTCDNAYDAFIYVTKNGNITIGGTGSLKNIFTLTTPDRFADISGLAPGTAKIIIKNNDITSNTATNSGLTSFVRISGFVQDIAIPEITYNTIVMPAAQTLDIVYITSSSNPIVSYNDITYNGYASMEFINIQNATALDKGSSTIQHNVIHTTTPNGHYIQVGTENTSISDDTLNSPDISYNTIYGPLWNETTGLSKITTWADQDYAAGSAVFYPIDSKIYVCILSTTTKQAPGNTTYWEEPSAHTIMFGYSKNAKIHHNKLFGVAIGVVQKGDDQINDYGSGYFAYNIITELSGEAFYSTSHRNDEYYNNTIYRSRKTATQLVFFTKDGDSPNGSTGGIVKNNILYGDATTRLVWVDSNSVTGFVSNNNNYYSTSPGTYFGVVGSNNYTTWENWRATYDSDSINSNPLFVNPTSDFSLQHTSPAINAGTNVGLTTDFEGNPKSGPNFDIGAYEFQDSTKPTTSADIVSGTYNSVQSVALACDDGVGVGCDKTYYTLTGIDPTTSSTVYSGAISIPDNATTVLKFFSRDRNENSETPIKSKTYTIDTTFPQTSIDSNPNTIISTNSAIFTFSASETATFQCKMDSSTYASCSTPKNYTSLSEGAHTFYVKATDTATNEDTTPASYTFTVDTEIPTISNLSPNNTTLSVTTTNTNLTLATSETTTCKYSITSGTDYASMTAFDSTNNTTHSTAISGLNSGTTYDYYIKCKDAINESAEAHLTFSIAPEENKTSLNSIKIKIERETNKFKDAISIAKNKLKLKQEDTNLANGTVKIYKDGKRIETVDIGSDGIWSQILKLKDDFSGWIKIRQYDQFGTLLSTDKAKIKVDTENPKFNKAIPEKMTIGRNSKIDFTATDDNSGIDYYKVKLTDIRDWRQQNEEFYQIPEDVPSGTYDLFIRAYDKAGSYAEEKTTMNVVRFKNSVNLTQLPLNLDSLTQNTQSQNHTDKNTDTTPSNSSSNNSPSSQPQAQPKTSHWWNPFSWF